MEIEKLCARHITSVSSILAFYKVEPADFVVVELEGQVVGFLIGNVTNLANDCKAGHVLSLAVDPAFRRLGIGLALMDYFLREYKHKGAKRVFLEVKTSNHDARRFYARLGFEEVSIARRYYRMRGYTEDAVVMSREIPGST